MVWIDVERIKRRKEYEHKYYLKNKEVILFKSKLQKLKNLGSVKKRNKLYYLKNKEKIRKYSIEYLEKNRDKINLKKRIDNRKKNYRFFTTAKRRAENIIRKKTRIKFPIYMRICEGCESPAQIHHHYTNPIKFDKFYYLCHNCHSLIHQIGSRIGYSQEENVNK